MRDQERDRIARELFHANNADMDLPARAHVWEEVLGNQPTQYHRMADAVLPLVREAEARALEDAADALMDWSESPLICLDKCGKPGCFDDVRVETVETVQSWMNERAEGVRRAGNP